jgi:pimeloyl-ACP methyl ester carboxylesterase
MRTRLAQAPGSAGRAATHFRGGAGEPLVLVHGYANTWRVWEPVLPALTERHDVLAPTLCGHLDGVPLADGVEATVSALTDGVERAMDAAGFETAHVCGNSLGGWIALDLGRRGRARSVDCIAPAGGWEQGSRAERRLKRLFTVGRKLNDRFLPYAERLVRRPGVRKLLFRNVMRHPEHLTPAQAAARMEAMTGCSVFWELMDTILRDGPPDWLGEVDAPTLVAWPEFDRVLPPEDHSQRFRAALRGAEWRVLPGVGHVPMADDPGLVSRTILDWAQAASRSSSVPALSASTSSRKPPIERTPTTI